MARRGPQYKISREQLTDWQRRHVPKADAAREVDVAYDTIVNACNRYGIELLPIRGERARQMAVNLKAEGHLLGCIAEQIGCHPFSVYRYLRPINPA